MDIVQVSREKLVGKMIHCTIKFNIPSGWMNEAGAEHMMRELAADEAGHLFRALKTGADFL